MTYHHHHHSSLTTSGIHLIIYCGIQFMQAKNKSLPSLHSLIRINAKYYCKYLFFVRFFSLVDLSTLEMVHKSTRTTLDRTDIVYCADLCDIFMDQSIIFQFGKCIHLLFHSSWLLWRLVARSFFISITR